MFYKFKAIKDNKRVVEKIEADSESSVITYLNQHGYFPISIKPVMNNFIVIQTKVNRVSF